MNLRHVTIEIFDAEIAQKFNVMRNTVFHHISKHQGKSWKYDG